MDDHLPESPYLPSYHTHPQDTMRLIPLLRLLASAAVSVLTVESMPSRIQLAIAAAAHPTESTTLGDSVRGVTSNWTPSLSDSNDSDLVSTDDASILLEAHNAKRATVGAGPLTWDSSIAAWATDVAKKCVFQHSSGRNYAENLAGAWGFETTTTLSLFEYLWSEGKACGFKAKGCSFDTAGHYLNIIAPDTKKLGCAAVKCSGSLLSGNSAGDTKFLVCDYSAW